MRFSLRKINVLSACFLFCFGAAADQAQIQESKNKQPIKPFKSDGCSLFPDRNWISNEDWLECCVEHDIAYWQGGTSEQREKADLELKQCVIEKTGNKKLAQTMYLGVRAGGSPYFYNWYRWGYGWPYGRRYRALSDEELIEVERELKVYYEGVESSGESKEL